MAGILTSVMKKLGDVLGDEYQLFKGVRRDAEDLREELKFIDECLKNLSKEETSDVQDLWMNVLWDMSYEIQDSLDMFMLQVDCNSTTNHCDIISRGKNMLAQRKLALKMKDSKERVKEVAAKNLRYRAPLAAVPTTAIVPIVDQRALAMFKSSSELVGVNKPADELIRMLKNPVKETMVVSIVGSGGLGKTTVASRVHQDLQKEFDCSAMVSISRNPDLTKILRTVLSKVTGKSYMETEAGGIEQIIEELRKTLTEKRYFIIVDDIWTEETWRIIKLAFPENNCGSRIITTTRIHDVAVECCRLYNGSSVYKLKPLSDGDSKVLFMKRFPCKPEEFPANLNTVSDCILKKCAGMPLAIITISALLYSKAENGLHSVEKWKEVESSLGRGIGEHDNAKSMNEMLAPSYYDLDFCLRSCLLYLSLFPEDYIIEKGRLVRAWIAEGFVSANGSESLYERGEMYFNKLINRSLIQAEETTKFGEVNSCRVHDIILDFIVIKAMDQKFATVAPTPEIKVHRLALHCNSSGEAALASNQYFSSLRSLFIFAESVGSLQSILNFKILRVLDLDSCISLENKHLTDICELSLLKYLGLRETTITELPEQIGKLRYLQTLDIQYCRIKLLPKTITQLRKLTHLLVNDDFLEVFGEDWICMNLPCGIRNMKALEVLKHICVDVGQSPGFLEEIGELSNMRYLDILLEYNPDVDKAIHKEYSKTLVSSISQLHKLRDMNICFPCDIEWEHYIVSRADFLHEIQWFPASLRKLKVEQCSMSKVPSWMHLLSNLIELSLPLKRIGQQELDILGGLPILFDLHLDVIDPQWESDGEDNEEEDDYEEGEECNTEMLEEGSSSSAEDSNTSACTWMGVWQVLSLCISHSFEQFVNGFSGCFLQWTGQGAPPPAPVQAQPQVEPERDDNVSEEILTAEPEPGVNGSSNNKELRVRNSHRFPSLRYLEIKRPMHHDRLRIPMLIFEDRSMPNLEVLSIEFDSDITDFVTNGHYDFGLGNLGSLRRVRMTIYGSNDHALLVGTAIRRALEKHQNHPRLDMVI